MEVSPSGFSNKTILITWVHGEVIHTKTVRGTIEVYIPRNTEEKFTTSALVKYRKDSMYKSGKHVTMNFNGSKKGGYGLVLKSFN